MTQAMLLRLLVVTVCCLVIPTCLGASSALVWSSCSDNGANFYTTGVTGSNATVTPSTTVEVTLIGILNLTVTDGMYQMQVTDTAGGNNIDQQFGTLKQFLTSPFPIASGAAAQISFAYTVPDASVFSDSDTSLTLQLDLYSQALTQLVCVQLELPLEVPPAAKPSTSKVLGYGAALISVVFFGTNFLPVKQYDTGDGVFFQWMLCIGVWLCGLVVQLVRNSPPFEPFAMLGGMMWAIGNMTTVPIIQLIGLGVGMCLWGGGGLVMGWAAGRFGLLGVKTQAVENEAMNVIGLLLCIVSMGVMFNVKSVKEEQQEQDELHEHDHDHDHEPAHSGHSLLQPTSIAISTGSLIDGATKGLTNRAVYEVAATKSPDLPAINEQHKHVPDGNWTDKLHPHSRRILGITLSLFAGCLYGLNFNPPQYLIDSGKGSSSHGIDYVFSHFTGIILTSTVYMIVYCIYKRNAPQISSSLVLPGMASGMGWAIAQISWFVANDQIHFVGTFPLVSCGPGVVATVCAIIFYKEIQGKKNFMMLALAAVIIAVGVVLIAFSLPAGS